MLLNRSYLVILSVIIFPYLFITTAFSQQSTQKIYPKNTTISNDERISVVANDTIPQMPSDKSYTLGINDEIEIKVLRHDEVSGSYIVNNEGKIQYEFVGDIPVGGMTKDELKNVIVQKLSEFIIAPEVTVKIKGYNSKVVYVIGEVNMPGKIFMRGDTITVREALVQAGLPLLSAKLTKGKLITPSISGNPRTTNIDVEKLLIKGDLRENLVMKPGDTLYIPPTGLAKVMRAISPITEPISNAGGAARSVPGVGY